jgi:DNA modification methylase
MNRVEFGDCRETMRRWASEGINAQTCVTSPPYFGLRDYGHPGQIGLEQTPEEYIAAMVEVFRCVRDVLADDGTLWLNLGDSYGKGKQLQMIPARVAIALQADGWVLRQDIIWRKPNPMPESVTDRCTKAHEYLFLLAKSERYFFDNDAIKEPANLTGKGNANGFRGGAYVNNSTFDNSAGGKRTNTGNVGARSKRDSFKREASKRAEVIPGQTVGTHRADREESDWDTEARNRRSVWTVATVPYKGAHFATFPPALIEPCILAGTKPGQVVLDPFFGSGTTGMVAQNLGRQWLGCELNPAYGPLQDERLQQPGLILEAA